MFREGGVEWKVQPSEGTEVSRQSNLKQVPREEKVTDVAPRNFCSPKSSQLMAVESRDGSVWYSG